ncbi:MAG: hypothetical protein RSB37_08240 [Acetivibrio sp.]
MFGAAFLFYAVRFLLFGAIAGAGIFAGIVIRKNKNSKVSTIGKASE